ncbi:MAG: tetratricopeptide repeat protein, partial [Dissulfurispiraceae bacterium]
ALEKKFNPSPLEIYLKNFAEAMTKKDFQRAEDALGKAAALVPEAAKVVHNFGLLHLAKGEVDKAIGFFKAAITKNPMFVTSYNALGEIYENMGDLESAIKYYKLAYKISPDNTERIVTLSKLYYKTGDTSGAETILRGAVSDMRTDVAASAHLMGEIYLAKNENEKALEMLIKSYSHNPSDMSIMESLAEAYRKVRQPEQALKLYNECIKISPDNALAYYNMSKTYLEMSDKNNAIETMKKAWTLNPQSKEITADLKALAEKDRFHL